MNSFLQLVSDLITSQTGSLAYHLVLVFSIGGALQVCFNFWDRNLPEWRRMLAGVSTLMGLQCLLFLLAVLAWWGLFDSGGWIRLISQSFSIFSLVIIIWLWACPYPSKPLDTAALVIMFLTLAMAVLFGALTSTTQVLASQSEFSMDRVIGVYAILLISAGIILLLQRKPIGWEYGFAVLVLLFTGYLAYFVLGGVLGAASSTFVRLAEMAAYPLLLALPQRYLQTAHLNADEDFKLDQTDFTNLYSKLVEEPNTILSGGKLVTELAELFQAEFCMLVEMPDPSTILVRNVEDTRTRKISIPPSLDVEMNPLLVKALQDNKTLRFPASSHAADMTVQAQTLGGEATGHMMVVPVRSYGYPVMGILLTRAGSLRSWTDADADEIWSISSPLVHFLHLSDHMAFLQSQLELMEGNLQKLRSQSAVIQNDTRQLQDESNLLRQDNQEKLLQLQTLADMVSLQQDSLAAANLKIQTLSWEIINQKQGLSRKDLGEFSLQLDELRQPLSSIQEQTDYLLGESMGTLGAMQRKFIDRIRISSERATHIVDDLIEVTTKEQSSSIDPQGISNLNNIVDTSVNDAIGQLKRKQIVLRIDVPDNLPGLITNEPVLQHILVHLLNYAAEVSPSKGEIILRAFAEGDNGHMDYVILQVTDSGKGLAQAELMSAFSPKMISKKTEVSDLEVNQVDLSDVYQMVNELRGRIWIDNEPGQGSTVSLLLPVSPLIPEENENQEGTP